MGGRGRMAARAALRARGARTWHQSIYSGEHVPRRVVGVHGGLARGPAGPAGRTRTKGFVRLSILKSTDLAGPVEAMLAPLQCSRTLTKRLVRLGPSIRPECLGWLGCSRRQLQQLGPSIRPGPRNPSQQPGPPAAAGARMQGARMQGVCTAPVRHAYITRTARDAYGTRGRPGARPPQLPTRTARR